MTTKEKIEKVKARILEVENELEYLNDTKSSLDRDLFYLENPESMPKDYFFTPLDEE